MTTGSPPPTPPPACGADRELADCRILLIAQGADRSRIPLQLLWWLRWVVANTDLRPEVLLLGPGPLRADFEALVPTHVIDTSTEPTGAEVEVARAVGHLDATHRRHHRDAVRSGHALGHFDVAVITGGMAGAGLHLLRERPAVVVSWVHLLGTSIERLIGPSAKKATLSADWFVTAADSVSAALVGAYRVDRSRVVRHHGFIDPFAPDPSGAAALRAAAGIPPHGLVLGGVGVQHWRKGPDLFVQVVEQVRRTRPDLDVYGLWAGGPDPLGTGAPINVDVERLGLADRVHLLPAYDDPAAVMGAFDVFCLTSRDDPFPLVLLEAGLQGLPIVCFASGGVHDLGLGGSSDSLVNVVPYLAVEAFAATAADLLDDPQRRQREGERLQRWVRDEHLTPQGAPRLLADLCTMVHTTVHQLAEPGRPWQGATL